MLHKLKGGNFDLDLVSGGAVGWPQDPCPWNTAELTATHRCAVKNTSICPYFAGLGDGKDRDTVRCSYPVPFAERGQDNSRET
jgi:hypothetical protein